MLRTLGRVSLVLLVMVLSRESRAFSILRVSTQLCQGTTAGVFCSPGPAESGAGASTSFQHDYGGAAQNLVASAAAAIDDYDDFAFRTGAMMDFVLGPAGSWPVTVQSVSGTAFVELFDVLTVTGGTGVGTVRMQWAIRGGVDIGFLTDDPLAIVNAGARLRFTCGSQIGPNDFLDCNDPVLEWSASEEVDELVTLDVEVLFGAPTQWVAVVELGSGIGFQSPACQNCVVSFQGRSNADFLSTAELVGVQLLDAEGNVLDPSGIQGESGFRYDLVGEDVAEPLGIAWSALAALGAARRRMVWIQRGTRAARPARSGG